MYVNVCEFDFAIKIFKNIKNLKILILSATKKMQPKQYPSTRYWLLLPVLSLELILR